MVMVRRRSWRWRGHGNLIMKKWMLLVLGLALSGVLVQVLVLYRDGAPHWLLPADTQSTALNFSRISLPQTRARGAEPSPPALSRGELHVYRPYRFLLNEPDACSNDTELVMMVITAVNNTLDRQAVRETWGSYRGHHAVVLVFLVGATPHPDLQAKLVRESAEHHDIVQGDFVDSYRNLSLKSLTMLSWVSQFCNASTFVLKADDDMYVNVTNLLSALRSEARAHSTFVLGHLFRGVKPVQNKKSKWYTPKEAFGEAEYPRYTSGTAYSMTTSAARELYAASAHVPVFWLEDVYVTGLCARKAGVPVLHHGGFSYIRAKVDGCHFRKVISGHRYSAQEKRTIFRLVNDPHLVCR